MVAMLLVSMVSGVSASPAEDGGHLSRRNSTGRIAVRSEGRRFPGNASVSFARTRTVDAMRQIKDGLDKIKKRGVRKAAPLKRADGGASCYFL